MARKRTTLGTFLPDSVALGTRYGRLVTIASPTSEPRPRVRCLCDCGREAFPQLGNLRRGRTTSCGCARSLAKLAREAQPMKPKRVAVSRLAEYWVWQHMKSRCMYQKDAGYPSYGAKGITVDERWRGSSGFSNFFRDMGPRPSLQHDIDRIDSTRGYGPDNCRWLPRAENAARPRPRRHKTHCKHGHAMTPENTYLKPGTNEHRCRACHNAAARTKRGAA